MTDPWEIIDGIAQELGVDTNTRRVWRQRHVPHKWRLPILREAERRGLSIQDSDFEKKYAEARF